jgi:hypothetical protein
MDCTGKDVKIRIKFAPSSILYKGVNVTGTTTNNILERTYTLSNVYATIDSLDEIPDEPTYLLTMCLWTTYLQCVCGLYDCFRCSQD